MKLQTIPMYNYPLVVNLLVSVRNVVLFNVCALVYTKLVVRNQGDDDGEDTTTIIGFWDTVRNRKNRVLIAIGFLDALALILAVFSNTYLPGNLVILLTQAVIPVSLVWDRVLRRQIGHDNRKYLGAMLITFGIITAVGFLTKTDHACLVVDNNNDEGDINNGVSEDEYCTYCEAYDSEGSCNSQTTVLENGIEVPLCHWDQDSRTTDRELGWAFGLIVSSLPIYLSTLLKVNSFHGDGAQFQSQNRLLFIAISSKWQLISAILLTPIFGALQDPAINFDDLIDNLSDGFKCSFGEGTIEDTCFPDDECSDTSQVYVNLFLIFNAANILLFGVLNNNPENDYREMLWFSLSLMIPICSLIYVLPGFPDEQTPSYDNFLTVLLIVGGTIVYRKGNTWEKLWTSFRNNPSESSAIVEPLLSASTHAAESAGQTEESRRREVAVMFVAP